MISSYQMPNYWTWRVFLCVCDGGEKIDDVVDYYNSHHGSSFIKSGSDKAPCCLHDDEHMTAVVCINDWKFDPFHVGIVAHEVFHLLTCISAVCECPMNIATTECWAYTMSSFVETFIEVLNNRSKKKRRHRCKKAHSTEAM